MTPRNRASTNDRQHADEGVRALRPSADDADASSDLREAIRAAEIGTWTWKLDVDRVACDARALEIFGAQPGPSAQVFAGRAHPGDSARVRAAIERASSGVAPIDLRFRILRDDAVVRYVSVRGAAVEREDGRALRCAGVCADVTELQRDIDALVHSHAESAVIMRSFSSILVALTESGRVKLWNRAASTAFGIAEEDALGRDFFELFPGDAAAVRAALAQCLESLRDVRVECTPYRTAGGEHRFLGMTITPIVSDLGSACLITGRDITRQKGLEVQLAHAMKLEAIGRLAAGIAHEINTPTQFVSDNVRFLHDSFQSLARLLEPWKEARSPQSADELLARARATLESRGEVDLDFLLQEVPAAIDEARAGLERVTNIVVAMKDFSHPGSGEKVPADLNHSLHNTVVVARNEWKYHADVEFDLDPKLPRVPCLPDEMNQVFLNLVVNAGQAIAAKRAKIGGKGKITIASRSGGDHVEIRVGDDGTGIAEEIGRRIYDPFFTTKGVGQGTGQGLAIARSVVVDKHGGSIDFESKLGEGTTFIVRIPLHGGSRTDSNGSHAEVG